MGNHDIRTEVEGFREHQRDVENVRGELAREERDRAEIEEAIAETERARDAQPDDFIKRNNQYQIDYLKGQLPGAKARVAAVELRLKQLLAQVAAEGTGVVLGNRALSPAEIMAEADAAALDLQHPVDRALLAGQLTLEGFGALLRDPSTNSLANDYLMDLQTRGQFEDVRGQITQDFFGYGGEVFDAWLAGSIRRQGRSHGVEHDMPSGRDLRMRIEAIAAAISDPQPRPFMFTPNQLLRLVADRLSFYVRELIAIEPRIAAPQSGSWRVDWSGAARSPDTIEAVWFVAADHLEMVLALETSKRLESRLADPLDTSQTVALVDILADLAPANDRDGYNDWRGRRKRAVQLLALMQAGDIGLRAGPAR